jgi:hypothetical protein
MTDDGMYEEDDKLYSHWKKVTMWVKETFYAESDVDAIRRAKDGDYWCEEFEYGDTCDIIEMDEDGNEIMTSNDYKVTEELYDEEGELLWDNKPLKVQREEKLKEILNWRGE